MPDTKLAETLLRMASKDLRALEGMQGPPFDDEVFGFHAQQCLEKALKAWLCLTPTPFPRTHDLDALVRLLDSSGQSVPEHLRPLVHLSDFAVEYRYAEMPLGPLDRADVTDRALELLQLVSGLVRAAAGGPAHRGEG